ncbi:hypothetical protein ACFB49_07390 [Sphingomonas sp. DBB INV C78]|uniref:hypothetical protein n=1 Tax=Sphingomonas sp. DBB INV C78 TaxID=3349434 RepID=UPI0036D3E321
MKDGDAYSSLGADEAELIRHRRAALGLDTADAPPLCGLALSGGGIRSATFALGLIQGMARTGWLARVDILSTVSGGGYTGAFLRSLFIPQRLRFAPPSQARNVADGPDFRERHDWAMRVLAAPAGRKRLYGDLADADANTFLTARTKGESQDENGVATTANPLWWLREHGRYLTPNGGGDYIFAFGYLVRAWVAMQYVAVAPLLAIFLFFKLLNAFVYVEVQTHFTRLDMAIRAVVAPFGQMWFKFSPLMLLSLATIFFVLAPVSTSFWMTATSTQWQRSPVKARIAAAMLVLAALFAALLPFVETLDTAIGDYAWAGPYFTFVQVVAVIILVFAYKHAGPPKQEIFNSEVRRLLTEWQAMVLKIIFFLVALGIVDSLALSIVHAMRETAGTGVIRIGGLAALVPIIVWIVHKLQAILPRFVKLHREASMFSRALPGLLLACGVLAYGIIGVLCAAAAYLIVWDGVPFRQDSQPLFASATALFVIVTLLTLVVGFSVRFLNLSSLHYIYAGRLTRAYLGATNARRLAEFGQTSDKRSPANVREYDEADAVALSTYHHKAILAPVHLINTTANETRQANSQLVQRDRKGNNLCVGPGGISLGDEQRNRSELAAQRAENLSIGKWIAISGAAASSAMGQATSLGTAMLLTFANVRLGYWWYAPELAGRLDIDQVHGNMARHRAGKRRRRGEVWRLRDLFETQSYLLNEAAAEFSRVNRRRLNLSDGGHFENCGAYELVRRRLPIIILSDAAADPNYDFEDFSNLARKARIDLGAEIRCLDRTELAGLPGGIADLCGLPEDFRKDQASDQRCALLCRITYVDGSPPSLMVVIKPRVPHNAPPDIAAYHRTCSRFPQEPTVDQFFGEAQWESYRMLGEVISERIFGPSGVDQLMALVRSWQSPPVAP